MYLVSLYRRSLKNSSTPKNQQEIPPFIKDFSVLPGIATEQFDSASMNCTSFKYENHTFPFLSLQKGDRVRCLVPKSELTSFLADLRKSSQGYRPYKRWVLAQISLLNRPDASVSGEEVTTGVGVIPANFVVFDESNLPFFYPSG
eukprot:Sdes_comp15140_c0_seq1m3950